MKKKYICPDTLLHKVQLKNIITASPVVQRTNTAATQDGEVMSRRYRGVWDEDEEDKDNDW